MRNQLFPIKNQAAYEQWIEKLGFESVEEFETTTGIVFSDVQSKWYRDETTIPPTVKKMVHAEVIEAELVHNRLFTRTTTAYFGSDGEVWAKGTRD